MLKKIFIFFLLSSFVTGKYNFLIANDLNLIQKFGIDQNLLYNFNEYQQAISKLPGSDVSFINSEDFYRDNIFSVIYGIEYLNEKLYITDCPNSIVKVYNIKGEFLYNLNDKYKIPAIDYPSGITSNGKDTLYIVEEKKSQLIVVNINDGSFEYVNFLRDKNRKIKFDNPLSIDFFNEKLFLTDTHNDRILIFDTSFNLLHNFKSFDLNYKNFFGIDESKKIPISYPYYIRALSDNNILVNISGWNRYVEFSIEDDSYNKKFLKILNIFGNKPDEFKFSRVENFIYDHEFDAPNDMITYNNNNNLILTSTNDHSLIFFEKKNMEWNFIKKHNLRNVKVLEKFQNDGNNFLAAYSSDSSGLGVMNIYSLN
jgi:hypothetical protein